MEIEILESSQSFEVLLEFVMNVANYLITNGNVINHGDTVGESEDQRILVYHSPSIWGEDERGTVLKIEYK